MLTIVELHQVDGILAIQTRVRQCLTRRSADLWTRSARWEPHRGHWMHFSASRGAGGFSSSPMLRLLLLCGLAVHVGARRSAFVAPSTVSARRIPGHKAAVPEQTGFLRFMQGRGTDSVRLNVGGGATEATGEEDRLSLGAPRYRPLSGRYITQGGVQVTCQVDDVLEAMPQVEALIQGLDSHEGVVLTSSYEYPGRYARWTMGFLDPPLKIESRGREFTVSALNERGKVLLSAIGDGLEGLEGVGMDRKDDKIHGTVAASDRYFPEEERSRQPSIFTVIRAIVAMFYSEDDPQLGLYGSFGYDLTFQFEPIRLKQDRSDEQRDVVLYVPDRILVVDQDKRSAWRISYDFRWGKLSTTGLPRVGKEVAYRPGRVSSGQETRDTPKGAFSDKVEDAKKQFKVGNLFEVVLSQTFMHPCESKPSEVFSRLRRRNPSPYGFLMNLGSEEYLIGASPEMFVRCERTRAGIRVETCPISGTIARGSNALEDAARIKDLLFSPKEESELTMCTDVDRNDKSRICEPGSVRVLGRRQIEMYSRLIHTVDHVEGYLRPNYDALDAFLCHTWAVTVTGAPKTWAIQFIEDQEASPRAWYGGAVGLVAFDGSLNTGLTLRTIRVRSGVGEVRAGATLLYDSDPQAEEAETELKASALVDALVRPSSPAEEQGLLNTSPNAGLSVSQAGAVGGKKKHVLLVDHQDSFVHTLANYLRQTGAEVVTLRSGPNALAYIHESKPDLVVLSPGPGCPDDFKLKDTIQACIDKKVPMFGVCLGLQGMVEYFGGSLGVLDYPMHGKASHVLLDDTTPHAFPVFEGIPNRFEVARYHSLYGKPETLPPELHVTALSEDGIVMAIEHTGLPIAAVQFHPESILTNPAHGLRMLANAVASLNYKNKA